MDNRVTCVFTFLMGIVIGGVFMYKYSYEKAHDEADLEIEEMRNYYRDKYERKSAKEQESAKEKSKMSRNKPAVSDLTANKVENKVNYTMYSTDTPENVAKVLEPVILNNQDEFGEDETYSQINLTYYSDNVLAESVTNKVLGKNDVDRSVGKAALYRIGEKDENGEPIDQIWVRNDRTHTYYSVVRDLREFAEAVGWEDDGEDY